MPLKATKLCWLKYWLMLTAWHITHPPASQPVLAAQTSLSPNAVPWSDNQRASTGKKPAAKGIICASAFSEPPEESCKTTSLLTTITPESCWIPTFKIDSPSVHPLVSGATAIHSNQTVLPEIEYCWKDCCWPVVLTSRPYPSGRAGVQGTGSFPRTGHCCPVPPWACRVPGQPYTRMDFGKELATLYPQLCPEQQHAKVKFCLGQVVLLHSEAR